MELAFINLLDLLTVAPNLVPEVFHQPSVRNPIAVSLGAIAGALSRYYLSLWLAKTFDTGFPCATVFVNLTGSFLMGLVTTLILERTLLISPEVRLLIAVGFLNGAFARARGCGSPAAFMSPAPTSRRDFALLRSAVSLMGERTCAKAYRFAYPHLTPKP